MTSHKEFGTFEKRDPVAEKSLKEIGEHLRKLCPPGYVFVALIASVGPDGNLFYASNADRNDVVRVMGEFIEKVTHS